MTSLTVGKPKPRRRLTAEAIAQWWLLSIRHDLLVARFIRGLQARTSHALAEQVTRPAVSVIGTWAPQVAFGDRVRVLTPQLLAMRAEIERVIRTGFAGVQATAERGLASIAAHEIEWLSSVGGQILGESVAEQVVRSVEAIARDATWLGDTTAGWFGRTADRAVNDAQSWVVAGLQQGLSAEELTRGMVGTRTQTGVMERVGHATEGVVRTAATSTVGTSRQEGFRALGIAHWRFVATLDLRTSIICISQDGKIYSVGEGPMPPLHPHCRSVPLPAESADEKPVGERAALGGRVPAHVTAEKWLPQQTAAEQDLVLGKTKAAAWRAGKLTIRQMLGRDLEPLTLDELRALDRL